MGFLALLLPFAQQVAFAHVISHLDRHAHAKEHHAHSQLCAKCISFEKLSHATPRE